MLLKTRQREVYDSISKLSKSIYNLLSIDQLNYLSSVASLTQSGLEKLYNITTWGLKHEKDMEPYRSQISDVYSKLSNDQKNSTEGLAIKEILNPRVLLTIGDTLPPDILKDLEGNSHQFSEYLGKYVILDFWSTGCGGCMQMSAHLAKIQEKNRETLTVIAISIDTPQMWKMGTEFHKISFLNLSDSKGMYAGFAANFGFSAIPHLVLVDPSGKIIGMGASDKFDPIQKLKELLGSEFK